MSDLSGNHQVMHTPLVAWIGDYPEQLMIACISAKNSPISLVTVEQFGDATAHPPHNHGHMLQKIQEAIAACDPHNITSFHKVCLALHLNGVLEPFWKIWEDACPLCFLTPNALHQWHKFYFDHCIRWVTNITGEHCKLEKLLPAAAAGALPDDVLCMLHTITKFIFLAQGLFHCNETLHSLNEALHEIHHYKPSILRADGCLGKNSPLNHFQILKLELTQHVARSVHLMGAPYQWSSDITEHCHITHVKMPYCLSNRQDYHVQCCHFLD
ncbi:hypothetical protein EDD17DRAFT_1779107 [Pisolithus thermaeus]|nr:hypothetical protein EV401DRAFT_2052310 [Pisolithus croceorrhizus]KAI6158975.1 hypothetical protein EDD17DRAFT_1779107 [Pisolithus thermaeus]